MIRSWLSRWLWPRSNGLYSQNERQIFRYFNGTRTIAADPLVLSRELARQCPDLDKIVLLLKLPESAAGIPENLARQALDHRDRALVQLVRVTRSVFRIADFDQDGAGLTERECLALLASYQEFVTQVQEDALPLAIGPGDTGSPAQSITAPFSACGFAETTGNDSQVIRSCPDLAQPRL